MSDADVSMGEVDERRIKINCHRSPDFDVHSLERVKGLQRHTSHSSSWWLQETKDDVVGINYCVKTRSFGEVVRFFFVEEGMRKKAERERKRELEQLKLSRARPDPTRHTSKQQHSSSRISSKDLGGPASIH